MESLKVSEFNNESFAKAFMAVASALKGDTQVSAITAPFIVIKALQKVSDAILVEDFGMRKVYPVITTESLWELDPSLVFDILRDAVTNLLSKTRELNLKDLKLMIVDYPYRAVDFFYYPWLNPAVSLIAEVYHFGKRYYFAFPYFSDTHSLSEYLDEFIGMGFLTSLEVMRHFELFSVFCTNFLEPSQDAQFECQYFKASTRSEVSVR